MLVREFRVYENENGNEIRSLLVNESPLLDAARDIRVAAAEQIGSLLDLLKNGATKKIGALDKAIDKK